MHADTFSSANGVTFTATYFNETDSNGVAALDITLTISGYDATAITTTDGSEGMWMAVGFNRLFMPGTNCVVCYIPYTGSGTDKFTCEDAANSGYSGPVAFKTQTFITNVTTITNTISVVASTTSSLSVSFLRPCVPSSSNTNDDIIVAGKMNVIWAYGPYSNSAVAVHT